MFSIKRPEVLRREIGSTAATATVESGITTVNAVSVAPTRRYHPREMLEFVLDQESVVNEAGDVAIATACALSRIRHISNEKILMRVEDKVYIGRVNSTESGHYVFVFFRLFHSFRSTRIYILCFSVHRYHIAVDFASFYPSIGCQFGLFMETVQVLTVQQFLLGFG